MDTLSSIPQTGKDTMQTYQELANVIKEQLLSLVSAPKDIQQHFYDLKKKNPQKFERLFFDENGHKPFSKVLGEIISDLKMSGGYPFA